MLFLNCSLFIFSRRLPTHQWWMKLRPLMRILAMHSEHSYVTDITDTMAGFDETEEDDDHF